MKKTRSGKGPPQNIEAVVRKLTKRISFLEGLFWLVDLANGAQIVANEALHARLHRIETSLRQISDVALDVSATDQAALDAVRGLRFKAKPKNRSPKSRFRKRQTRSQG